MTPQEMAVKLVNKYGSQSQAALACGLSQPTIYNIISERVVDVKSSTIAKLKAGLKARKLKQ